MRLTTTLKNFAREIDNNPVFVKDLREQDIDSLVLKYAVKISKMGKPKNLMKELNHIEKNMENKHVCKNCFEPMRPVYDNVGFNEPDGPSKYEVIGFECNNCGRSE